MRGLPTPKWRIPSKKNCLFKEIRLWETKALREWKVFVGFSTPQKEGKPHFNRQLQLVLHFFAMIRLGSAGYGYELDEFFAAMKACQLYHLAVTPDDDAEGKGPWTLAMVHLLNGHLINRGFTPITFAVNGTEDKVLSATRASFNRKKYFQGKPYFVETRLDVIQNLKSFIIPKTNLEKILHKKRQDDFAHDLKMLADEGAPVVAESGETVTDELGDEKLNLELP